MLIVSIVLYTALILTEFDKPLVDFLKQVMTNIEISQAATPVLLYVDGKTL